ncbi:hypothetical protein HMI56_004745 [Coelomomyces lativittatus]|nr:hypothetical protein HMI56_004745 [Coelomomyces lativittatus]
MSNVSSSHFKQKLNDLFLQVDAKETKENSLSCSNHNPSKALALLHLPFIEHQEVQAPTIKVPIHDPFSHSDFLHRLHSFKNAPFFFSSCTLNPVDLAAHGWMHLIDMVLVCEVCHHQLILSTALQNLEVLSNADPSSSKLIQHYQTWMNVGHHATCGWLYQPCIERTMKCIVAPNQTKLHMDLRVASFLKVFQDLPVSLGGFEMGTLPYEYTQRYPHVPFVYLMAAHYHWTVMAEASLTYMKCDYCGRCVLPGESIFFFFFFQKLQLFFYFKRRLFRK